MQASNHKGQEVSELGISALLHKIKYKKQCYWSYITVVFHASVLALMQLHKRFQIILEYYVNE